MDVSIPGFRLANAIDAGSENPVVSRLFLQFDSILSTNCMILTPEEALRIRELLFKCMLEVLNVESSLQSYVELEDRATRDAMKPLQSAAGHEVARFDDPTQSLLELHENLLIRGVVAVRAVKHIADIVLDQQFRDIKNNNDRNKDEEKDMRAVWRVLKIMIDKDSDAMAFIARQEKWLKELYILRGEAEHGELAVERFDIHGFSADGQPVIRPVRFAGSGLPLRTFMSTTLTRLFEFVEETVVMLLNLKCDDYTQIVLVPENIRPRYGGFRYVADLKPERKQGLTISSESPNGPVSKEDVDEGDSIVAMVPLGARAAVVTKRKIVLLQDTGKYRHGGSIRIV